MQVFSNEGIAHYCNDAGLFSSICDDHTCRQKMNF